MATRKTRATALDGFRKIATTARMLASTTTDSDVRAQAIATAERAERKIAELAGK